jgi:lipopolysaccharide biosynthesis glycosyltransferase
MSETIPTLFCINAGYTQHAAVGIVSLLENNRDYDFDIVVVTTEPLGAEEDRLQRTLARYAHAHLRVVPLKAATGHLPVRAEHYTIDTYSRLWIAEIFPAPAEKALYLDSDMVVVGPIGELWQTDVANHVLAAVTIPGSNRCPIFGIPERFGYFQSGVLLVNLRRWREDRIFDELAAWIDANTAKIIDADQDALNACLHARRLPLPYMWNVIAPFYFDYHPLGISERERAAVQQGARIIHYNGPSKPWHYLSRHPRRADYWKYLRLTEWRDYRPADRSVVNWGKKHLGPFVPATVRARLKRALAGARA